MIDALKVTRLPSGMAVVTDTMPVPGTACIGAYVSAGARMEQASECGASHFLEHMAFKGTSRRTARDIAVQVEGRGAEMSAYTGREQTAYHLRLLAEDVAMGADILGDILVHSTFDGDEMERERGVILQEIAGAIDDPGQLAADRLAEAAFPGQSLGRPILGTEEGVAAMDRGAISGYMARNYSSGTAILAAAGAVCHEQVVDLAARHFADLPGGRLRAPEPGCFVAGEIIEERDCEQVHLALGFPGVPAGDADHMACNVLSTLLGGGMSSRLFQEVRERRGLAYSIWCSAEPFSDCGLLSVCAGTGEGQAAELMDSVMGELLAVRRCPGEEEVARAVTMVKAYMLMSQESASARCEQIAWQMRVYGRPVPIAESVARVEAITATDVARVAERVLHGPAAVAAVGPCRTLFRAADISLALAA